MMLQGARVIFLSAIFLSSVQNGIDLPSILLYTDGRVGSWRCV
jgi:hypothetical protein